MPKIYKHLIQQIYTKSRKVSNGIFFKVIIQELPEKHNDRMLFF